MVTEELKKYVRESFISGKTRDDISKTLLGVGWEMPDIEEAFQILGIKDVFPVHAENKKGGGIFIYSSLVGLIVILTGTIFYLWQDRLNLTETNTAKVQEFYARLTESQIAFTDSGEMVFPDEQKFLSKKTELLGEKSSFIEANLRTMKLTLYENGAPYKVIDILTKGKEGSWWETPTGNYTVLGKNANAFSSIGNVWMPYSIQFYGNYFIHGWPHYNNGSPVAAGYSGGCIRLSNDDAKLVFNFAKQEMPLLVLEDDTLETFGAVNPIATDAPLPNISAQSFLIYDISSGKTILEKNVKEKFSISSLTKLMTAITAHEVIYLGRSIEVTPQMVANVAQVFSPTIGERYIGLDLLYPLLMQSSDESAKVLSGFVGEKNFVQNMNTKALSLEMTDTRFTDSAGAGTENISTSEDIAKLLQYIYFKRHFIFDITKGVAVENVGLIEIGDTIQIPYLKNLNTFVSRKDLVGIKSGETNLSKQHMASVWNVSTSGGTAPVAIIVLESDTGEKDTEALYDWVTKNSASY